MSPFISESEKLAQDLQKVEQLESKITTELDTLKSRIEQQQGDIVKYTDLDKVRADAEARKDVSLLLQTIQKEYHIFYSIPGVTCKSVNFQKLNNDKVVLHKRKETFKKVMQQLAAQYEALKAQLNENETYTQVRCCTKFKVGLSRYIVYYFHPYGFPFCLLCSLAT